MDKYYTARHLVASHPDYRALDAIQMSLCAAYNPCTLIIDIDIEPCDIVDIIQALLTAQGELMDRGNFEDFKALCDA